MTDREMLELAARAAGYKKFRFVHPAFQVSKNDNWNEAFANWVNWNPLTDPGDALRLAVALGFSVIVEPVLNCTYIEFDLHNIGSIQGIDEPHKTDPLAATMRAIVRAAAEIGRTKT